MLSHTSTFDVRSKAADWHSRFAFSPPSITLTAQISFTYPVFAIPSIHRDARFVESDDQSADKRRPIQNATGYHYTTSVAGFKLARG